MLEEYVKAVFSAEDINKWFDQILEELEKYLERPILVRPTKISLSQETPFTLSGDEVLDFGINKEIKNGKIEIKIDSESVHLLKFIMLREAFYSFLPKSLENHELLKVLLLSKASNMVKNLENFDEWESILNKNRLYVNWRHRTSYILTDKGIKHFIYNIQQYASLYEWFYSNEAINEPTNRTKIYNDFNSILMTEFLNTSNFFEKSTDLEVFRLLYIMFNMRKKYKNKKDFEDFFKTLLEVKKIKSNLTLNEFKKAFSDFSKRSVVAPNYQVNWNFFNIQLIFTVLKFNGQIEINKTRKIIEHLPFYMYFRTHESKFGIETNGYFCIPNKYVNDLKKFLLKLKEIGILKKMYFIPMKTNSTFLNLNYFKDAVPKYKALSYNDKKFDEKLLFHPKLEYGKKSDIDLDLLEIMILNRIRWWAGAGFEFERSREYLRKIKGDLFKFLLEQRALVKDLKENLNIFYKNPELNENFLDFLTMNKKFGFFYIIEQLQDLLDISELIEKLLLSNLNIKNQTDLFIFLNSNFVCRELEGNIKFNNFRQKKELHKLYTSYFNNTGVYEKQKTNLINFLNLLNTFEKLKIYDVSIIKSILTNKNLAEKTYSLKISKIKKALKEFRLKKIKYQEIDNRLNEIVESELPGAVPWMVSTLSVYNIAPVVFWCLIKDFDEISEKIEVFQKFFPKVVHISGEDSFLKHKYHFLELHFLDLNETAKRNFMGVLLHVFGENLVQAIVPTYIRIIQIFSFESLFDYEINEFFYTKDLFEKYYSYVLSISEDRIRGSSSEIQEMPHHLEKKLFREISMEKFNENLTPKKEIDWDIKHLQDIKYLHENLCDAIFNDKDISNLSRYIKKIDLIPNYHLFGLQKYFVYLNPSNSSEIDWKMLFPLGFKGIRNSLTVGGDNSLLFEYIFPYEDPNFAYFNWITHSKKAIAEYMIFNVKEIIPIINFDYNVSLEGFTFSYQPFELFIHKILFDKQYSPDFKIKRFKLFSEAIDTYKGENTEDYIETIELIEKDLKKSIQMGHNSTLEKIKNLIRKNVIFPCLKLMKNRMNFKIKFYIIVPNLNPHQIEQVIKIFHFLNYGFIYLIEGKYYIKGMNEEIRFENGLFLKFHLPNSDYNHFKLIIKKLFEFLGVKHYLMFFDLVKGDYFVNNLFGNFKHPNPLKCHIWDEPQKKWYNHKSITEKFDFIYPEEQVQKKR